MTRMKDSGIEWIGEIPEDWEVVKLKNISILNSERNTSKDPVVLSLKRSGVVIRDISNNEGQLASDYTNYNRVKPGNFLLNPMDLVSGANCNISYVSGVISPAYFNLSSKDNGDIRYLCYYIKMQYWSFALFAHGKGVSFENRWTLNRETLINYKIPIPPKAQQEKIADFLDQKVGEIDRLIEKTKEVIGDYKSYKQSLITETVTKGLRKDVALKDSGIEWIGEIPEHWEVIKLKYLVDCNKKVLSGSINDDYKIRYIDISSVDFYKGILGYEEYLYKNAPSRARRIVKRGDIIISTVRTYLKSITRIEDDKDVIVSTGFAVLTPKNIIDKYLEYIVKTEFFINNVIKNSVGVSYPAINPKDLTDLKVVACPLDEQKEIAGYLDEKCGHIDMIIETKEGLIKELEAYKKSLIYETVTGKREVD